MAMNWFDVPDGVTATVSRPAARSAGPPDHHARSHRHLDLPLQAPAAEAEGGAVGGAGDRKGAPWTSTAGEHKPNVDVPPPPANDDRKSAIVTAKRRPGRFGDVPDMTLEEHRWRGDVADALFREMVRRAAGKD